jgi:hypothetical protein
VKFKWMDKLEGYLLQLIRAQGIIAQLLESIDARLGRIENELRRKR